MHYVNQIQIYFYTKIDQKSLYMSYRKRKAAIFDAFCIGTIFLIILKLCTALYFIHYAPFYINLFILSLG